jgi:hypothetical protein
LEYHPRFDCLTLKLSQCKVVIPPLLLVMLFLRGLQGWYSGFVDQFRSCFKPIELATINSIISDITHHNRFTLVDSNPKKNKPPGAPGLWAPAAALANTNTDCSGKVWQSPWEWLAQYNIKGFKGHWTYAAGGTEIRPICHRDELPHHVPAQCPLLKELGFKLVPCPPASPAPVPPAMAPSPSSRPAAADASSVYNSTGLASAPLV